MGSIPPSPNRESSQRELLAHWFESLDEPDMSADAYYEKRKRAAAGGALSTMRLHLKDGRVIEATTRPTPDGGWVTAHEDVTERLGYEKVLREQNMLFDAALENMSHGLCVFDKDWRVVVRNRRYLELYGLGPDEALPGTPLVELMRQSIDRGMHTAKLSAEKFFADFIKRVTIDREPVVYRRLTNGKLLAVRHEPLENGSWVGTYEDITERERAADALKEQHRRFDVALNNMAHGLAMMDADMRLIVCNKRYVDMFGMSPSIARPGSMMRDLMEHSVAIGNYRHRGITGEELYNEYVAALNAGDLIVHRHLADGRMIKITHEPMPQGGWVAIYEDITERHRAEESIAHMARHDALTQLPNRVLLREKMAEGLARVEQMGEAMAVFYLDLDNFKGVNDTLGHPIGDKLLGIIAKRIRGAAGEGDTIARLGGDEFAILQFNSSAAAAGALARSLVEVISEPIEIDGQEINSGVSVGIALAPDDGNAADHLMKCADLALYRAKAEGRGTFRFFEPDMDARIQARRALEVDLRRALSAGEFSLHYQPQINLATNELVSMEALLRWTHAERGPVPPAEFIPLAEETGLIVPLGEWVLREACNEAARWPEPIKVAVNLSPVQFRNRGLVTTVTHALAAARLAPGRLELEITEAVLLQDDEMTVTMLHRLRALGVRVAMDDFGTGYSSLELSAQLPVRQDQDRPLVHQGHRAQPRQRRHHQGDREPRHEPRHPHHGRGRRDRGAARNRAPRRLHRDAGLSGEPAGSGLRSAAAHRALPPRGCGGVARCLPEGQVGSQGRPALLRSAGMTLRDCAALRKHAGHRQSSPESAAGIGRRKSSSAHQQCPVPTPHSNAVPQRAQARRRTSGTGSADRLMRARRAGLWRVLRQPLC